MIVRKRTTSKVYVSKIYGSRDGVRLHGSISRMGRTMFCNYAYSGEVLEGSFVRVGLNKYKSKLCGHSGLNKGRYKIQKEDY